MKVQVTEIECTAEELRQSNTIADGIMNILRRTFNGPIASYDEEEQEDENEDN